MALSIAACGRVGYEPPAGEVDGSAGGNGNNNGSSSQSCSFVPGSCPINRIGGNTINARTDNDCLDAGETNYEIAPIEDEQLFATTVGSTFDTMLVLLASCTGPTLACSDDFDGTPQSDLMFDVAAGETVVLSVIRKSGTCLEYHFRLDEQSQRAQAAP